MGSKARRVPKGAGLPPVADVKKVKKNQREKERRLQVGLPPPAHTHTVCVVVSGQEVRLLILRACPQCPPPQVNVKFDELATLVEVEAHNKSDKVTVLVRAIQIIKESAENIKVWRVVAVHVCAFSTL